MKNYLFSTSLVVILLAMATTGCGTINPVEDPQTTDTTTVVPNDTIHPQSFPRKQMIEHFTSQSCGYCPYGMDLISEAINGKENQYVWLSNHSGYADDIYTIKDSKTLATKFNVNSAPSMMLNRAKWSYSDNEGNHNDQVFHPAYLETFTSKVKTTAPASINIKSHYAQNTFQLTISGETADEIEALTLTVAIKESGLHGIQYDYLNTWEGWDDFVHSNVVRQYVTSALGDVVEVANNKYEKTFDLTWNSSWDANNCSAVAFIANQQGEIINAEETPIVEGTKGGSDIEHKGITATEVPETYPEVGDVDSKYQSVNFRQATFYYAGQFTSNRNKAIEIDLMSLTTFTYQRTQVLPAAVIYLVLDPNADTQSVPNGTFQLSNSTEAGTAWAGFKDDSSFSIGGSSFYYAYSDYAVYYNYITGWQWLLVDGTVTITDEGLTYEATTLRGNKLTGKFTGKFNKGQNKPAKKTLCSEIK